MLCTVRVKADNGPEALSPALFDRNHHQMAATKKAVTKKLFVLKLAGCYGFYSTDYAEDCHH